MPAIRYRVPYEFAIHGTDLSSGKAVTNIFYLRSGVQSVAPPAYGAPIAGPSDLTTLMSSFIAAHQIGSGVPPVPGPLNYQSVQYQNLDYTARAIIGKRYATPQLPISSLVPGAPTTISTAAPHFFASGDTVFVAGVTTPTGANGTWLITVVNPTTFTLNGSSTGGPWSGDGSVQRAIGQLQYLYADRLVVPSSAIGGIAGEALSLFATASVRRLNTGVGRNWKSRISFSPLGESQVHNGRLDAAAYALIQASFFQFHDFKYPNGGSDFSSGGSFHGSVSKTLAFQLASPFTTSDSWFLPVTGTNVRINNGSLVRRKPRLTSPIA